jgi:GT2 family glycosyltransferase
VIVPADRETWPLISIIIPTKDAPELIGRCLDTIFEKTSYRNFEVIVVDNGTTNSEARAAFERHPVRVVPFNEPFNFSRGINLGAAASKGDYLLLLNNDTEIVDPAWLDRLAFYLELPKVGAVGPLLLYPDGTVQHAGVALGLRGTADHVMRRVRAGEDGYAGSLSCSREVAAVTAACLMVRKSTYDKLGGLNELFGTIYQDVDFCLRLRRENLSILYVSATRLIHHESASRGRHYDHLDRALLIDAWAETISAGDPFHDPRVPGYHQ